MVASIIMVAYLWDCEIRLPKWVWVFVWVDIVDISLRMIADGLHLAVRWLS